MSESFIALKVFIAAPRNLKLEREEFLRLVERHNLDDAHESNLTFIPRGLEFAFAGVGRPQELINQQVRESDYLVVVLWDWWGQPTGNDGLYSSGTAEEFQVGIEALKDPKSPMRDVIVLFKGVNDKQLSDPGEQLLRVLEFKKELEISRLALYTEFDDVEEFRTQIRRHLNRWTRDWGNAAPPPKAITPRSEPIPLWPPVARESVESALSKQDVTTVAELLEEAARLADTGRNTEAERLFAQATTVGEDVEAYAKYAKFLRKTGRYAAADATANQQLDLARSLGNMDSQVDALANLGIIQRLRGQKGSSATYFQQALKLTQERLSREGAGGTTLGMRAYLLDNLALTLRKTPEKMGEARTALDESIAIRAQLGDERGKAFTLRTLGVLLTQTGELHRAKASLQEATAIFRREDYGRGVSQALASLAETHELLGELPAAEECVEEALALATAMGSRHGRSADLSLLSRIRLAMGKVREARDAASSCLQMNEASGNQEGLAAGLQALGRVLLAEGKTRPAIEHLQQAHSLFDELSQPIGVVATLIDLSSAYGATGRTPDAVDCLERAFELLERAPHYGLAQHASYVRAQLESSVTANSDGAT